MRCVDFVDLGEAGLQGDHARAGKRAVTLFQQEHLATLGSFLGTAAPDPGVLRRNIHVKGLNLAALKGVPLRLGTAIVEITIVCAPCSRMHEAFGPGGYNALRGHGGWCAQVLTPGIVEIGDTVTRA